MSRSWPFWIHSRHFTHCPGDLRPITMILFDPILETWLPPPPLEMPAFSLGPHRSACLTIYNCSVQYRAIHTLKHITAHLHTPNTLGRGGVCIPVLQRKSLRFREAQRTFHSTKLLHSTALSFPLLYINSEKNEVSGLSSQLGHECCEHRGCFQSFSQHVAQRTQ